MAARVPFIGLGGLGMVSLLVLGAPAGPRGAPTVEHAGMCDASAGVALDATRFVAASDEDNVLRVYRWDRPGSAVDSLDLNPFLGTGRQRKECDLEGAARVGDRLYWITSHGRDREGRVAPARQRFFACRLDTTGSRPRLEAAGRPYERLLDDFLADPRFQGLGLREAATRSPKSEGGLSIEALAAGEDGRVWVGFRNPLPKGRALVAPLLNPQAILFQGERARLGEPRLLELGGLGLRDMCRTGRAYLLLAGPAEGGGRAGLFEWDGRSEKPRPLPVQFANDLNPEAVMVLPGETPGFLCLSDDGSRSIGGCDCKDLKDPSRRAFRSFVIRAEPGANGVERIGR